MNTSTLARSTELEQLRRRVAGLDLAADDQVDLVDVGAEEQERGQRRRGDRVALGQRLGRVADGVEAVGDLARAGLGAAELGDAAGVVGDRAEGVHRQDVGRGHEHAHRRDGGAEDAADVLALGVRRGRPATPSQWLAQSAMPIVIAVTKVVSKPTAMPEMMFVAGPVLDASAISRTGPERAGGVVLGDVDEGDAGREADDAGAEEADPRRAGRWRRCAARVHHHVGRDEQADDRQDRGDPVAAVEHVHRVLVLAAADEEDRDDRGQQPEAADDEREEDPGLRVRPAGRLRRWRTRRRRGSSRRCSRPRWTRTGRRRGRRSRRRCRRRGRRSTAALRGSSSGMPASTLPTRSEPTSAAFV